jgi:hypothetical protein
MPKPDDDIVNAKPLPLLLPLRRLCRGGCWPLYPPLLLLLL